ncbi:hypothetical protein [Tropicibacter sp. S64]|uniref:hypothetical protein n=1 Tax=Tropicibacter sp. S64 TaxID=3415122 RepID=UPI003C7BFD7F
MSFRRRGGEPAAPDGGGFLLRDTAAGTLLPDPLPKPSAPDAAHRDAVVAEILARVMARWGHTGPERLGPRQRQAVARLERVLRASPSEAAILAQDFVQPAAVLDLRDTVANAELELS